MNFCTFWKLKFIKSTKLRGQKIAKMAILDILESPKLISRKIWVIEKSWNFHIIILRFAIFRSRSRSRSQERRYRRGPSSPRASSSSNSMSPIRKTNRLGKVLNSKDLQAMTKTNTMIVSKGGKLGGKYVDSRDLEDIFHGRERYVKIICILQLFVYMRKNFVKSAWRIISEHRLHSVEKCYKKRSMFFLQINVFAEEVSTKLISRIFWAWSCLRYFSGSKTVTFPVVKPLLSRFCQKCVRVN